MTTTSTNSDLADAKMEINCEVADAGAQSIMRKTKLHCEMEAAYQEVKPKQFGNLHERVKFLSLLASEVYEKHSDILHSNPLLERMRDAIFDVESEAALNDCDQKSRAAGKRKAFVIKY